MKILIIVAHPDDEILGCGGILSRYKDEEKMLLTMTDGESSRNYINNKNRNLITNQICEILNIQKFVYGNFPDNELDTISLLTLTKFIENNVKNFTPDLIFTHHPNCLNIDHSIVYRAVLTTFRPQIGLKFKIYSFYVPSSTDYNPLNNFYGNVYFELNDENVEIKIKCLNVYKNEMREYPHSRSIENIINLMKVWGSEIGSRYCEKFQLIREIL